MAAHVELKKSSMFSEVKPRLHRYQIVLSFQPEGSAIVHENLLKVDESRPTWFISVTKFSYTGLIPISEATPIQMRPVKLQPITRQPARVSGFKMNEVG